MFLTHVQHSILISTVGGLPEHLNCQFLSCRTAANQNGDLLFGNFVALAILSNVPHRAVWQHVEVQSRLFCIVDIVDVEASDGVGQSLDTAFDIAGSNYTT